MSNLVILFIHFLATLARLLGPGGVRSIVAESLILKHQLLIVTRSRQRSPNLCASDRILAGLMALWTTADLEKKLLDFRTYFNNHRTHTSREGRTPDTPVSRPIANLRSFGWQPHCRSLFQTPMSV
jgi:hypothetical protein